MTRPDLAASCIQPRHTTQARAGEPVPSEGSAANVPAPSARAGVPAPSEDSAVNEPAPASNAGEPDPNEGSAANEPTPSARASEPVSNESTAAAEPAPGPAPHRPPAPHAARAAPCGHGHLGCSSGTCTATNTKTPPLDCALRSPACLAKLRQVQLAHKPTASLIALVEGDAIRHASATRRMLAIAAQHTVIHGALFHLDGLRRPDATVTPVPYLPPSLQPAAISAAHARADAHAPLSTPHKLAAAVRQRAYWPTLAASAYAAIYDPPAEPSGQPPSLVAAIPQSASSSTAPQWSWSDLPAVPSPDSPFAPIPSVWPDGLALAALPPPSELRAAQLADPFSRKLIQYLELGASSIDADARRAVRHRSSAYGMDDGVLVFLDALSTPTRPARRLIYVPQALQLRVAQEVHSGALGAHVGVTRLSRVLRARYYWPGMYKTAKTIVKACLQCAVNKARSSAALHLRRPMMSEHPWHHVHIDLWSPNIVSSAGHKYVLTAIDRLTNWPEMIPIKDKTAKSVATAFFENVLCVHGVPPIVVSDNGSEFCNKLFDELSRRYGIRRIRTTPYHPQANAFVERLHGFMRGAISALSPADQSDWHKLLPVTAFAYRATPHDRTGLTPFFLMHGREPVLPGELRTADTARSPIPTDEFILGLQGRLTAAFAHAREVEWHEKSSRLAAAPTLPAVEFAVDDKVQLKRTTVDIDDSHKLTPRWIPHVVETANHPNYTVRAPDGRVSRVLAQSLRLDTSMPPTPDGRRPPQPSASELLVDPPVVPAPDSIIIIRSDSPSEPWCLASVLDREAPAGYRHVHYYNRSNKFSSPAKWAWFPAHFEFTSKRDVLSYGSSGRH